MLLYYIILLTQQLNILKLDLLESETVNSKFYRLAEECDFTISHKGLYVLPYCGVDITDFSTTG